MKKILIVEDEKILSDMYEDKFSQSGYKVLKASEAEEGLKIIRKEKPDLVLLDILLPRENGIFFLKEWKNDPKISHIPVLAFSNFDDPETKKEARELGAKEYLIKSNYSPATILKKVNDCIEGK